MEVRGHLRIQNMPQFIYSKCKWTENFLGMENSWLIPRKKTIVKCWENPSKNSQNPLTNHALGLGLRFNEMLTGCAKVIGQLCFFPMTIDAWKLTICSKMHRWFLWIEEKLIVLKTRKYLQHDFHPVVNWERHILESPAYEHGDFTHTIHK